MIESGLKKAAAVSFVLHLLLFGTAYITISRTPSFPIPSPYIVRLVSPYENSTKSPHVPPQKNESAIAKVESGSEPKGVRAIEKEPPPKKKEDLTKYSDKQIAALRKEKETARYKEEKETALANIRKYLKVKEIGEQKASVEVTTKQSGKAGTPAEGTIVGDYTSMVASLIDQEWILFDVKANNIFAIITIRVMNNGVLKIINIERSSGDPIFDRSAIRAVEKASPVPAPPYEMELGVRFKPIE